MGSIVDRTLETYVDPKTGQKKKRKKAEYKGEPAQYYVTYKDVDGRWKMKNSKAKTLQQAKEFLREAEWNVSRGKVGVPERDKNEKTFAQVAKHWLETHSAAALTSHSDNVSRMKHLEKAFGKLPLSHVTTERVDALKAKMAAEKVKDEKGVESPRWRPNTINRVLALLRKVMNDAEGWGYVKSTPKVKLLPAPETPFDYLRKDEAERFLSHAAVAAPNDHPLYAAAIYTGARMGELFGLRWSELDVERGVATFARSYGQAYTKSKKVRRVRLNKQLVVTLKAWRDRCPKGDLGLAFPAPDGTMRPRERPPQGFAGALAASRCHDGLTFHDLRHTCASLLVMAGVNLRVVQQILGHSTIAVTEKYAHLAPDFMEREADRLSLDVQPGLGQLVAMQVGA
jgi:integrase